MKKNNINPREEMEQLTFSILQDQRIQAERAVKTALAKMIGGQERERSEYQDAITRLDNIKKAMSWYEERIMEPLNTDD